MIIMPTLQCKPGMKLGRSVYSERRQVLARRGFELSEGVIRRFHEMGFPFLHVEVPGTEDIVPEPALQDETLIVLQAALSRAMREAGEPGRERLSFETLRFVFDAAGLLAEDIKSRSGPMSLAVHLAARMEEGSMRHFAEHGINVAVCATRIGVLEGLPRESLIALALGGLLHDIGRLRAAEGGGAGGDGNDSHAEQGYLFLRDSGFPTLTSHCALFHHERVDGSGYPCGLAAPRLHDMVQWVGILDAFENLIHGRTDGRPKLPHEALEVLYGGAGRQYDLEKIKRLRDRFDLFPIGTVVRLSAGETGVVCRRNEENRQRPFVRVIRGPDGTAVRVPYEIDLAKQLHLMIEGLGGAHSGGEAAPATGSRAAQSSTGLDGARAEAAVAGLPRTGLRGKEWLQFI